MFVLTYQVTVVSNNHGSLAFIPSHRMSRVLHWAQSQDQCDEGLTDSELVVNSTVIPHC